MKPINTIAKLIMGGKCSAIQHDYDDLIAEEGILNHEISDGMPRMK